MQLIQKELLGLFAIFFSNYYFLVFRLFLGYHGDIVCLQEVDRFMFEECLAPTFSLHQYAAAFANKQNTKEGVAVFYNRLKFK